jgi:hypothetical protein
MFETLKDFLRIFTWKEFWMAASIAFLVVGAWAFISLTLAIPNDSLRAITLWGFIFLLSILGGISEKSRRKRKIPRKT